MITTQESQLKQLDPKETDNIIRPNKTQRAFIKSTARHPAFVAGWGCGKSMSGIIRAMRQSELYPNNLGVIFRKEYTDLRDSTLKDFENYTGLKVPSSRDVVLSNGSAIMFRHIEELNNIQNMNLGWYWIEQAEELETDNEFFILFGRMRRKGTGQTGFLTANAKGHNWIYKLWKTGELEQKTQEMFRLNPDLKPSDDYKIAELYESKTFDNKDYLDPQWLASLELLRYTKPAVYRRFVENSWEDDDATASIIKPNDVFAAARRNLTVQLPVKSIVSIDVARKGDDKTVFYALRNNKVIGKETWEKKNNMEVVGHALRFAKKHDIKAFAVDEIGTGSGVADRLQELEHEVIFVNSARKSKDPKAYKNTRAEIYDYGARLFEDGRVDILDTDEDLKEELPWTMYAEMKSTGVFLVESKDDIKKRHGRSPDHADAFLNGLWALQKVKEDYQGYDYNEREYKLEHDYDPFTREVA